MNKFRDRFDPKYVKVCLYVLATFFTAVILLGLAYLSGGFWQKIAAILAAVMKPLVTGLVITYLFSPITNFFEKKLAGSPEKAGRSHRAGAVAITMILIAAAVSALLMVLIFTVMKQVRSFDMDAVRELMTRMQTQYSSLIDEIGGYLQKQGLSTDKLTAWMGSAAETAAGSLKNLFFGLIFAIYFLYDGKNISAYWRRAANALFRPRLISAAKTFLKDADQAFSGYIRGQFTDALAVGVLVSLALTLARVPYGPIIGIMTGIGNMIPYVGPIVGYAMIILSGLVNQDMTALLTGVVILGVIQVVDANVLNPRLLSNAISIHPLYVIACVLAGGALGGVAGMLIAVPTGALLKKEFERFLAYRSARD